MKIAIIAAAAGGLLIAGLMAFANELGRYCDEINPYAPEPMRKDEELKSK